MIDLFKIATPVYGTTNIEAKSLICELLARLRHAEEDNEHFGWDIKRYLITIDENGQLWLSGETNQKYD